MGKSSGAKARITEYRMSMHVAVGHTLDAVTEIRIDEKVVFSGLVNANAPINVNQPNLFGGQQKEGGAVGTIQVLLGQPDQVLPAAVASRYGRAPNDCPAFRGITTLMFHGNGVVSTGRANDFSILGYIVDELNQPVYNADGFLWKSNSPVIAQKIEVTGIRAPKGLDPAYALSDDDDANFAHIIYECLTNTEWGMGGLPSLINKAGFEAAAVRLAEEGMFGSVWWMRQSTVEDFVVEMITHIQATLFLNPNSGLLDIKLLRDDYDVADLRHITPQNAVLSNFKRRSGGEIVNEMTVDYTNPITEQTESITAQDIASIQSQGGEKVSGNRSYYAFRNKELATKVLMRDLRASTAPLISADAKLDRSAWDILPGEVVLMSWPKRSTYSAVMRIGKVNYGKPMDSSVRASMLQDVFSLSQPPIALLPETEWEDPRVDPQPLTMQLFTVPAYFARNGELQTSGVELSDSEALVGALADSETYDSFDYELVSQTATAAGNPVFTSKGAMSMTGRALLTSTMAWADTSFLPRTLYPIPDEAPRVGGFVVIGYGDANQEFCLVTEQTPTGWTIARGCLDTVPKSWSAGTPIWTVNPGAKIVDSQTVHGEGTVATYRGLDRTARGLLGVDQAPAVSTTVTNRPHLPLRPAKVRVNGVGYGTVSMAGQNNLHITWSTRNRLLEDSQVLKWTDGAIQPEFRQETVVDIYDATTNALIIRYDALWTQTELLFNRYGFDRYTTLIVEVYSRRDGEVSLNRHRITVTGFAGNTSLPGGPPAGPPLTEPPSFYPAPAGDAFTCEAAAVISKDGSQTPILVFKGKQDRLEATTLTYRWRETGLTPGPYFLGRTVPLNREYIEFTENAVPAETELEVAVAYVTSEGPGIWTTLPLVTTLKQILLIDQEAIQEQIDLATEALRVAQEQLSALVNQSNANFDDRLDALDSGLNGVQLVIANQQTQIDGKATTIQLNAVINRQDGQETVIGGLVETVNNLPANYVSVTNYNTLKTEIENARGGYGNLSGRFSAQQQLITDGLNGKVSATDFSSLQAVVSTRGRTYFQASTPVATTANPLRVGDLWINLNDNRRLYAWDGSNWIVADDQNVTGFIGATNSRLSSVEIEVGKRALASTVTDLALFASTKVTTYRQDTDPPNPNYGDLLIKPNTNNGFFRYEGPGVGWVGVADERIPALQGNVTNLFGRMSTNEQLVLDLQSGKASYTQVQEVEVKANDAVAKSTNALSLAASADGKVNAVREVALDVNGRVIGTRTSNNGTTGSFVVTTDVFGVETPGNPADRLDFRGTTGLKIYKSNVLRIHLGFK